jgi:hypothetical protein
MSKVMWMGFTAATIQVAMGVWLVHEALTASEDDLAQCHEPLGAKVSGRLALRPRS